MLARIQELLAFEHEINNWLKAHTTDFEQHQKNFSEQEQTLGNQYTTRINDIEKLQKQNESNLTKQFTNETNKINGVLTAIYNDIVAVNVTMNETASTSVAEANDPKSATGIEERIKRLHANVIGARKLVEVRTTSSKIGRPWMWWLFSISAFILLFSVPLISVVLIAFPIIYEIGFALSISSLKDKLLDNTREAYRLATIYYGLKTSEFQQVSAIRQREAEENKRKLQNEHNEAMTRLNRDREQFDQDHAKRKLDQCQMIRQRMPAKHNDCSVLFCQGLIGAPNPDSLWHRWEPATIIAETLRIGRYHVPMPTVHQLCPDIEPFVLPAYMPFVNGGSVLINASGDGLKQAHDFVRSVIFRLFATVIPGKVKFMFVDPVGLGSNVGAFMHLQDKDDSDPTLVSNTVWSDARHIEQRLGEMVEHIKYVNEKCLRNKYANISEYNDDHIEVQEPYRVVVFFDFPVNCSDASARHLISIMQAGRKCGVYTFVVRDQAKKLSYGISDAELEQHATVISCTGKTCELPDERYHGDIADPLLNQIFALPS